MKVLERYLVGAFLGPFLWCLTAFSMLYVVVDLFGHLDEIIRSKVSFSILMQYYGASFPQIFVQVVPFAILLGTIYSLSTLSHHNEITAMRSSGMSLARITVPLLIVGTITSAVSFYVNDRIVPDALWVTETIKQERLEPPRESGRRSPIMANVTFYGTGNRLCYASAFDVGAEQLQDVTILEHDTEQKPLTKLVARQGRWANNAWLFTICTQHRLDPWGQIIGQPIHMKELKVDLGQSPDDIVQGQSRIEYMRIADLRQYIGNLRGAGSALIGRLLVELHYRIAQSASSIVVMLLGMPFALRMSRSGALLGLGISLLIGFVYYGLQAVILALGKGGFLPPLAAAWGANLLFSTLGIALLWRVR